MIVSWIHPKELALRAHTVLFQWTQRRYGQIHASETILNSFVFLPLRLEVLSILLQF